MSTETFTTGLKDWIKSRLGYPEVEVELTDTNLDTAITDAIDLFNHYTTVRVPAVARSQVGSVTIQLDAGAKGILYCKALMPQELRDYTSMNIFELMFRMVWPRMPIGDWLFYRSQFKLYQRARGREFGWQFDETTKKLYLDCWGGPWDIVYIVGMPVTAGDFETGKAAYVDVLKKAVLGYAKGILAEIRGKFTSVPAPGGQLMTNAQQLATDSAKLITEAETTIKRLSRIQGPLVM